MAETTSKQTDISVAKMEVEVETLQKDMTEVKSDLKAIRAILDRADGGWKMIMMIGGISAAIGGLMAKVIAAWPLGR